MVEASLFCAIIGIEFVFPVYIVASETVGHLKIAIKKQREGALDGIDATRLQLFLAWDDCTRLSADSYEVDQLRQGKTTGVIDALTQKSKELVELDDLEKVLGDKDSLTRGHVHLLVKIAPQTKLKRQREEDGGELSTGTEPSTKRLNRQGPTIMELLKRCNRTGYLPTNGDFLKLFEWSNRDCGEVKDIKAIGEIVDFTGHKFYVRKEILCVLEISKDFLKDKLDTGANVDLDNTCVKQKRDRQFIFTGSPGTGKSTILALICFYLGIVMKVPVVWYRCVNGGDVEPVTTLFLNGKYYQWLGEVGELGEIYEYFCKPGNGIDRDKCWFCLDGLSQREINLRGYQNYFTLLATAQFNPKGKGGIKQVTCLLPYWKQIDLENAAITLGIKDEIDVTKQYFVAGGNIRHFLLPIEDAEVSVSRDTSRLTSESANALLGRLDGCTSGIRMMGVVDAADAAQYILPTSWRSCVSSIMALDHLSGKVQPGFFGKLAVVAKSLNDRPLQSIALEYFFHALLRRQDFVQISYMEYDNVCWTPKVDDKAIMMQETGTISFGRSVDSLDSNNVKREGKTMAEFEAMMKRWAASPNEMDFWVPVSSVCETIDAVANWEFVNGQKRVERFCFLQVTKATRHVCKEEVLWKLAKPFFDANKQVCYVALLFDDDVTGERAEQKKWMFRLDPVKIKTFDGQNLIPLYVATY